ncbi:hypothetical protein [Clostridium kluyveri]|uniref:Uncharacterized protein n=2 Tax=Clostridium kluyveri TaxID=1534 RepID=A5N1D9_CLOK5|nr:hypothetical protein [Clostridium kluyveri]EDK34935.1 Hypothetical protein CKL_2926 [Clostridium kluyveri DSM 555]BAH07644.1 hypothetical protein CKR_2593 [Clostridium kluyveri NBRC 12016]
MKKNKKIFYSIIALILLVLIAVGVYIAQKRYYEAKAIENTRFITIIKNSELNTVAINLRNLVDTTMKDVVWRQSNIKDDKYFVTCTGDYHDINVRMDFYIHEGEKSNKIIFDKNRFYIHKEGKIVNNKYALYIIGSDFMDKKNMALPSDFKAARDMSIILANNMPMSRYEIDYDVFAKTMDNVENLDGLSAYRIGLALNEVMNQYNANNSNESIVPQKKDSIPSEQTSDDIYENDPELNEYD